VDSALHRKLYPKSWQWGTDTDFLAAILYVLQGANWQRVGGKGTRPKPVTRPVDTPVNKNKEPLTAAGLKQKQKAFNDELARRRAIKQEQRRVIKQDREQRRGGRMNG